MKVPLYCYKCEMLTGHTPIETAGFNPLAVACMNCGQQRNIPILRWILLILIIISLLILGFIQLTAFLRAIGLI